MKLKLLLVYLLVSSVAYSQTWQQFYTKSNVSFATTTVDGTDLYLAFTDTTNNNPFAETYNGSNWIAYNSGNAISSEAISHAMVLSTGDDRHNKLHLGYIDNAITKVEWYESDSGGNFIFKNTAAPGASTTPITYDNRGLKLFINITGTTSSGFIYNSRIGTKITNFNLMGGRELSGNTNGTGTFQFPRLNTVFGGVTDTEFDYSTYNETFVVEKYGNGFNQFGKIILSPSGTSRQFYGRDQLVANTYSKIDGVDGEFRFAAYDATNNIARVCLTPDGAATTVAGFFQYNVNATDNGVFKFEKYGDDYYLLYSDTNNKLQIDKYTNATSTWSTLTDPNITTSSAQMYDMFYYDGRLFIMHTDTSDVLTILELTTASSGCNSIVSIPDSTFKNALLAHGNTITGANVSVIDTNGDGEIQCTEASAYTGRLILNSNSANGISDVTGIEAFTSTIYILLAGQTSLSSIDVSSNTALTYLSVANCSLSNLDVSQNIVLETLVITNNNITSIDLTQNSVLTLLGISNNSLSSIDLSANSNLDTFYTDGNPNLTSINFNGNTNLFDLSIENSAITSLDLSNNGNLGEIEIFNNANLTSLNIANGNNPAVFFADFTGNPALSCIQIDSGFTPPAANWFKDATASYNTNCASLTTNDFAILKSIIYPNPVKNQLNVEANYSIKSLEVYSVTGKLLMKIMAADVIDTSELKEGVYFIKINADNNIVVRRFIKQ